MKSVPPLVINPLCLLFLHKINVVGCKSNLFVVSLKKLVTYIIFEYVWVQRIEIDVIAFIIQFYFLFVP